MLWLPTARLAVLQVTDLLLALPVGSATAPQPASVVPSAVKPTLPVGRCHVTVAVKVTLAADRRRIDRARQRRRRSPCC